MPSYWIRRDGAPKGLVKLEGVEVDPEHELMRFPYRPVGSGLGRCMQVVLDESRTPAGQTVRSEEVEKLPVDTILMIGDKAAEFKQIEVKPLGGGAVDPLTPEEKELLGGKGKLLWTETMDEGGLGGAFFSKAPVLRKTLAEVGTGKITTTNDLYKGLGEMQDEERTLVRDILKNNLLPLAKNVDGVSDLQFIFAMRLLDAVSFPGDMEYGNKFLDRVRGKIGEAISDSDGEPPQHLVNLQDLLVNNNRDEIYSGIGVLDKPAIQALLEFTSQATKEVAHQDKLRADQYPISALQLTAACHRMANKIVRHGEYRMG